MAKGHIADIHDSCGDCGHNRGCDASGSFRRWILGRSQLSSIKPFIVWKPKERCAKSDLEWAEKITQQSVMVTYQMVLNFHGAQMILNHSGIINIKYYSKIVSDNIDLSDPI